MAISGFADRIYEGRLPFLVEANNVNCDINNTSPSISIIDLFITPLLSGNILKPFILSSKQTKKK